MTNHQTNDVNNVNRVEQTGYNVVEFIEEFLEDKSSNIQSEDTSDTSLRRPSSREFEGLHQIARAMVSWIERFAPTAPDAQKSRDRRSMTILAKRIYNERVRRHKFFPDGLFGEPAWDILLDLFVAEGENELRAIKEVCMASHAPDATALRHIAQLAALGMVKHSLDRTDLRRKFLKLTPEGRTSVESYLKHMPILGDEASQMAD